MTAREHTQVLQHDGLEERGHQLIRRCSGFLESVDVGFGEYAALSGHFVQLDAVVSLLPARGGILSLALILSITAPVPPAHLSFIDGIFFLRPLSASP